MTRAEIERINNALDQFRLDTGRYPTTQEGIQALLTNPGIDSWDGPYLRRKRIPLDPWGNPYQYKSPGTHGEYDLYSYGADGTPGGKGENKDIVNWHGNCFTRFF